MNGQRISYRKMAGELVDSVNALLASGELLMSCDGEPVCSIVPAPARAAYAVCLSLRVRLGGSPLGVHLDAGALEAALDGLIPPSSFAALDDDLKMAVLEAALAEPLAALTGLLHAEAVLDSVDTESLDARGTQGETRSRDECPAQDEYGSQNGPAAVSSAEPAGNPCPSGAAPPQRLLFEVRMPTKVVRCTVLVDLLAPLPAGVLETLETSPRPRTRDYGGLPVPVRFELGAASLSAAEFRSLEPGDIVPFDECYIADDRVRVNVCNSVYRFGSLDGLDLTVENEPGRGTGGE
ncbi:MAG: FliM/FliN family flagellar motor switch protein [Gammaproteobacteria bacterium]|nr:FliM/FliN family flagellar motor switch protein [Gammaproteobacteria bacterium]